MKPIIKIGTAKSKKTGKDYKFLQITIGEYEGRLYPTKAEIAYIQSLVTDDVHKDFKKSVENDED